MPCVIGEFAFLHEFEREEPQQDKNRSPNSRFHCYRPKMMVGESICLDLDCSNRQNHPEIHDPEVKSYSETPFSGRPMDVEYLLQERKYGI
jgi:hypothetical protein